MKFKLTTSIIVVFLLGCKSDHSKNLTKISPTEYILLYEEYKFPNIDSLLIKDENNNRMHRPRLQHLLLENKIFIDLYKNKEGKIVEGIARKITDADQMIYDQVFKIDLSSLEKRQIQNLTNSKLKEQYLIDLWDKDQDLRKNSPSDIAAKHGWNSKEHKSAESDFTKENKRIFEKMTLF